MISTGSSLVRYSQVVVSISLKTPFLFLLGGKYFCLDFACYVNAFLIHAFNVSVCIIHSQCVNMKKELIFASLQCFGKSIYLRS